MDNLFSAHTIDSVEAAKNIIAVAVKRGVDPITLLGKLQNYVNAFYKQGKNQPGQTKLGKDNLRFIKHGQCPVCGKNAWRRPCCQDDDYNNLITCQNSAWFLGSFATCDYEEYS